MYLTLTVGHKRRTGRFSVLLREDRQEARSVRQLNEERKWRPCLGCGQRIFTDRCHRFCRRCRKRNRSLMQKYKGDTTEVLVGGLHDLAEIEALL